MKTEHDLSDEERSEGSLMDQVNLFHEKANGFSDKS